MTVVAIYFSFVFVVFETFIILFIKLLLSETFYYFTVNQQFTVSIFWCQNVQLHVTALAAKGRHWHLSD